MSEKFKNKYRTKSMRLSGWDYRSNAAYFITICTKDRKHYFGEIDCGKMNLNATGDMAEKFWNEIPQHFPFVELGEFVVMPNHVHGIIIINRDEPFPPLPSVESLQCNDSTDGNDFTQKVDKYSNHMSRISPKPGSISTIIRSYKSVVTKNVRLSNNQTNFKWQSHFYDHIIRDEIAFRQIENYILNNPEKWIEDRFFL